MFAFYGRGYIREGQGGRFDVYAVKCDGVFIGEISTSSATFRHDRYEVYDSYTLRTIADYMGDLRNYVPGLADLRFSYSDHSASVVRGDGELIGHIDRDIMVFEIDRTKTYTMGELLAIVEFMERVEPPLVTSMDWKVLGF